jgi:hypothetical protein
VRALLFALAATLFACAPPPPPPPVVAAPQAPVADQAGAETAARLAIASLKKRSYNVGTCASEPVGLAAEADLATVKVVDERCAVKVARQGDGGWLVVVRSPTQLGSTWARVIVNPGLQGVTHVEYKSEATP